jgi:hypothetical protein
MIIKTQEATNMDYEEIAQLRYQEMCRMSGMSCLLWSPKGETKRVAIADVIRTEISRGWISGT